MRDFQLKSKITKFSFSHTRTSLSLFLCSLMYLGKSHTENKTGHVAVLPLNKKGLHIFYTVCREITQSLMLTLMVQLQPNLDPSL